MRNGGPTAYRAELAHRATERRARRRKQRPAPRAGDAPQAATDATPRPCASTRRRSPPSSCASGLPKMMSRVLTCLYTTDAGSLTAAELVRHLQVSPASVSKAIAFLESQDLIRRERDERRREHYIVDNDVWYQAMIASARSIAQVVETARQGVGILGPGTRPPPASRTSPASSTSSARAPPALRSRPARSSTPKPKPRCPTTSDQERRPGSPTAEMLAGPNAHMTSWFASSQPQQMRSPPAGKASRRRPLRIAQALQR